MKKSPDLNDAQRTAIQLAVKKAVSDPIYREICLTNPQGALAEVGFPNASSVSIKFVDHAGADYTIVLPHLDGELSDEKLDMVAGGDATIPNTLCCEPPLTISTIGQ